MTGQLASIVIAMGMIALLLGFRTWRLFQPRPTLFDHPVFFFGMVFLALVAMRAPYLSYNRELNPDESQMLAQAMRYQSHPMPWRDVDGTTSGPLDSWILNLPMALGAPADWMTARKTLLAAQCATLVFIYLAIRCFCPRGEAQIVLMPTVLFYAFTMEIDTLHYSSETVPVLIITIITWLVCRGWMTGKFSGFCAFVAAFLTGCLPFAKLQATPMAVYLAAAEIGLTIFFYRKACGPKIALLCLGGIAFPALLLGTVAACGAWHDFSISYILGPAGYAHGAFIAKAKAMWFMVTKASSFRSFIASAALCGILLLAVGCYVSRLMHEKKLLIALAGTVGFGLLSFCSIMEAGRPYLHYLLFLVPALALFFGIALALGKNLLMVPEEDVPHLFPRPVHWFFALFALTVCLQMIKAPDYYAARRVFLENRKPVRKSFVARRIAAASRPGDTLSVWGWLPSYYVETGLVPATRDAIGHFLIEDGPYRDYYRRRYLGDLKQNPPMFFVDAMADGVFVWNWWKDIAPRRHESFPELKEFVDENYSLWLTVHILTSTGPGLPIRVYVQKTRMAELKLSPQELNIPEDPLLAPE